MGNSLMAQLHQESLPSKDDNRMMVREFQGFMIYIGKNSQTNEKLVTTHPHRDCLWIHAAGARGSHVVICRNGMQVEFTDDAIRYAGALALQYSKSTLRSIFFTLLENVIKLPHASTGSFFPTKQTQVEIV